MKGEREYLRSIVASREEDHEGATIELAALKSQHRRALTDLAAVKDQELRSIKTDYQHALVELAATRDQHQQTLDDLAVTKSQHEHTLSELSVTKNEELVKLEKHHQRVLRDLTVNKDKEWEKIEQDHQHALSNLASSKDNELKEAEETIRKLRLTINELTREKLEISHAQVHAREQVELLTKREKIIKDLRRQLMDANLKVINLEDENEIIKENNKQSDIDDLRAKLREKTSECDRQRSQAKLAEARSKQSQERLLHYTKNGASLQGAVHLVKPQADSKLPKTVHSCTRCYANNLDCDSDTICRSCTESNVPCLRWRCSLKHKLGECPLVPCKFPHDSQGWLMLPRERPQW